MELRNCKCGGRPEIMTARVAEDAVETWVECPKCAARTEEVEDAYPDYRTAARGWNRGERQ